MELKKANLPRKSNRKGPAYLISSPLDWTYIDRTIFLALISLFVPLIYGSVIAYGLYLQHYFPETAPIALNRPVVFWYLGIYCLHFLGLVFFIGAALRIRKQTEQWPLFWRFVSYSWALSVLIPSFLAGTYYIDGVLMLLLGFTLSLPLQNHRVLMQTYFLATAMFFFMVFLDLSGTVPHAPLFEHLPYIDEDPWQPWHQARLTMAGGTFLFSYITATVTIRWRKREQLYQDMSTKDGLTGLASRNYFLSRMQNEFEKAQSRQGTLSCIMIDLDFFKKVNDVYGHHVGDFVLEETAKILMANARKYDEVGRYGGEEFALLLPDTPQIIAAQIAKRICSAFSDNKIRIDGMSIRVTASLGVASYPDAEIANMNDLLKKADSALYAAKNEGRNKVVVAKQKLPVSLNG
ncbi:MAG: GGDEF domain-containing protein [Pseudomonadota bacterium]|nr:GGDEF domain-containing protein [Pseudomonadota bacterium]